MGAGLHPGDAGGPVREEGKALTVSLASSFRFPLACGLVRYCRRGSGGRHGAAGESPIHEDDIGDPQLRGLVALL